MKQTRALVDVPARADAPALARRIATEVLTGWDLAPLVPDARLIVSELVTNAIRHAPNQPGRPDAYELGLLSDGARLRLSCTDGSVVAPIAREAALHETHGRGLAMVAAIALRWGWDVLSDGKQVWADLEIATETNGKLSARVAPRAPLPQIDCA